MMGVPEQHSTRMYNKINKPIKESRHRRDFTIAEINLSLHVKPVP